MVVDIDPRNGATEEVIASLPADVRANPWCVRTGGGGWHSYYRKPADVRIVSALKAFPGVDFKTKGGQVVAPGSTHPATGALYEWKDGPPCFDPMPDMPEGLLDAITRPESTAAVTRGGQLTPEQLEAVLEPLDPTDYPTNELWQPIMMASHHATGGAGLEEFVAWSRGDHAFSESADQITVRWTSCDPNKKGGYTIRTLCEELKKKNALHVLPPDQDQARADFEGEEIPEFYAAEDRGKVEEPIKLSYINSENINTAFRLVNVGGKVRVVFLGGKSSLDKSVQVPEIWTEDDFKRALRNKFVNVESTEGDEVVSKRMPLASWWLTKKDRYTYNGLIFDSTSCDSEEDEINLWRGFGVKANPGGDWSLMRKHIRDIIANGDAASDAYIMKWLAWAVQNPTKHCEVAIVFLSEEKGTGKGFLGRAMCRMFGSHGLHISQRSHLVGKFNAHFMQCGLLFGDEVIWPGHKEDEGVVKALITEPTLTVEPKGINAYSVLNALKLILASNEPWVVSASGNERRYAVFEVSDKHDFPPLGQARARFHEARPWWPAFDASVTDWESEFTEEGDE